MGQLRKWVDVYILLMLSTVGIAAVVPARGVGANVAGVAANAGIVFLFFLYGARLSTRAALEGLLRWRLHVAVLLSTFVLFPVLGVAYQRIAPDRMPAALNTGILFLCVLPSTVQSSIAFTSIARGNVAAALCAASASNLIGIVLSPFLASWLLHTQGVALSLDSFRDIGLQLLAPFFAGQVLQRWIGAWVQRNKTVLGMVDRGSILLIIYVAFSKGMVDHVWRQVDVADMLTLLAVLAGLLALALAITGLAARRVMRLNVEDEIVLQFCGSKKSLASGLPIANVLFSGPAVGLIVLPLMIFHQLQLIVCAFLARRYAARSEAAVALEAAVLASAEV